jgi:hypothetical protein
MGKRIALKDLIEIDGNDLSNFCRSVEFSSEHDQVDVSGFNPTGANEFLAGQTVQSVTLEMFGAYGTGETHDVLYDIHRDRSIVNFRWRPDQTQPVSATNPQLTGNVQILTYGPGATRGEPDVFSVTLSAADAAGLVFVTTA